MASLLMKSVSGIRGIVGETLTPEVILKVGTAFAGYASQGTIVLGRDTRPTGMAISSALASILSLSGCRVIDLGIVPTPTVQVMVEELRADGGVVVSASHNPIEWNAFKLIGPGGSFLPDDEIRKFFALMDTGFRYPPWDKIGQISQDHSAEEIHQQKILSVIDRGLIQNKNFCVVLDSVNGAGSGITQQLLARLGCRTVPLNCDMNGTFPRGAEPIAENLKDLTAAVIDHGADIGFAQDPDADRLAIVDENGLPIGEEYTIALVADHLLSSKKGTVVVNLSTTRAVDAVAQRHGVPVVRTRVGEIHVVEGIIRSGARIGGEGNGGVISPEVHLGRDSLAGIGYVLEMMAARGKSLSGLVADIPRYVMRKGKVPATGSGSYDSLFSGIRNTFGQEEINDIDGLRIDFIRHKEFMGGWVHLRPSNTEPVFRIISEGTTDEQAENIYRHFAGMLK